MSSLFDYAMDERVLLLLSVVLLPNIDALPLGASNLTFCPLSKMEMGVRFLFVVSAGPIFRRVFGNFERARRCV